MQCEDFGVESHVMSRCILLQIGGSSLPSVSGFCGDCAPVIGSFEVSLSIDQRKLRLASVRALRRFQQSPFILSQSVIRVSSLLFEFVGVSIINRLFERVLTNPCGGFVIHLF